MERIYFDTVDDAVTTTNEHLFKFSNGLMKNCIDKNQLTSNLKFMLINATYFTGNWKDEFNSPTKQKFTTSTNQAKKINMITGIFDVRYHGDDKVHFIELPIDGDIFSIIFIVPQKTTTIEKLNTFKVLELCSQILGEQYKTEIEVTIPQFSHRYKTSIKKNLTELGVGVSFDKADLTKMISDKSTVNNVSKIDDILHEVVICINEKELEIKNDNVKKQKWKGTKFIANKTFIYFLRHTKTGAIIYTGIYDG